MQAAGAVAAAPAEQILFARLSAQIGEIARSFDGVLGVAVTDLATGQQIAVHADEVFPSASSIKVAVLVELFRQAQASAGGAAGLARLDAPYVPRAEDRIDGSSILAGLTPGVSRVTSGDLATFMIVVSDNTAANVLIDRVGMAAVNRTLASAGLQKTRLRRRMLDAAAVRRGEENTATPRELAALFAQLAAGKLLDAPHTAEALRILSLHKEGYATAELPEDVPVASKPGSLDGARNDTALVRLPRRPFVVSVMTSLVRDGRAAEAAIAQIAGAAYRVFERLDGSTPLGRRLPPPPPPPPPPPGPHP